MDVFHWPQLQPPNDRRQQLIIMSRIKVISSIIVILYLIVIPAYICIDYLIYVLIFA